MAYSANRYENMLKEYIIDEQQDAYSRRNINYQRYNNLKIFMTPSKVKTPHVWIRIGISEACFSLIDSSVITGSIGQDVRYVVKWLNKPGVKDELGETWIEANKAEFGNENNGA